MGNSDKAEKVLLEVLAGKQYVSRQRLDEGLQAYREATRLGMKVTLLKFLLDSAHLDERQVREIRKEMMRRGINPMLGEYEIIQKLGEGSMGSVYKARHPRLQTLVAIKILLPEIARDKVVVERFKREARLAAKLQDADIIQVLDVQEAEGKYFIVMQFVDGESVDDRIKREGRFPQIEALSITVDAARSLSAAHQKGIVHRDIKPSNIMITKTGRVKIGDLGLSKCMEDEDTGITDAGVGLGTANYISPEQAKDTKSADGRADIYSLGATFYHMLTGQAPFSGTSPYDIIVKHMTEPLKDPRHLNPGLAADTASLVMQMMEKDREMRIQTCLEVAQEADRIRYALRKATTLVTPVEGAQSRDSAAQGEQAVGAKCGGNFMRNYAARMTATTWGRIATVLSRRNWHKNRLQPPQHQGR